eukprot:TRINITY_DN1919_c0_g1_i1.p1 TRINITY_DN1919_c0_g1~~TRINITY_DN1919_c0_g1_i1.p1  ORF type:complete len:2013 (+),score=542.93 TRINITY_DN1919_c0_g1_i1:22-6060(+)
MASGGMANAAEGLRRAYQAVLKRFKTETSKQGGDQELPVLRKDLAVLVQEAQSRPQEAAPEVRAAVDALASRLLADGSTGSEVPVPRADTRRVMGLIAGFLQQTHSSSPLLGGSGVKPALEGQLPKGDALETNLYESEPSDDAIKASLEAAYAGSGRQTLSRKTSDRSVAESPHRVAKVVPEAASPPVGAASPTGSDSAKDKAALLREKLQRLRKGVQTEEPALGVATTSSQAAAAVVASIADAVAYSAGRSPSPGAAEQQAGVTSDKLSPEGNLLTRDAAIKISDAAIEDGPQCILTTAESEQFGEVVTATGMELTGQAGEVRLPATAHTQVSKDATEASSCAEEENPAASPCRSSIQSSAVQTSNAEIDAAEPNLLLAGGEAEPPKTALDIAQAFENVQSGDGTTIEAVVASARKVGIDNGQECDQAQSADIARDASNLDGDATRVSLTISLTHTGDVENRADHVDDIPKASYKSIASTAGPSLAENTITDDSKIADGEPIRLTPSNAAGQTHGGRNGSPLEYTSAEAIDTTSTEATEAVEVAAATKEDVSAEQTQHQAIAGDSDGSAAALKPGTSIEMELDAQEEARQTAEAAKKAAEEETIQAAEAAKNAAEEKARQAVEVARKAAAEEKARQAAEAAKKAAEEQAQRAAEDAQRAEEAAASVAAQAAAVERLQGSLKAAGTREAALLAEAQAAAVGADAAAGRHAELREQLVLQEKRLASLRASIKTCRVASEAESAHHATQLTSLRQAAETLQQQTGGYLQKSDATAGLQEALACQQKAAEALGQSLSSARAIRKVQHAAGHQQVEARFREFCAALARRRARKEAREEALDAAQKYASVATLTTALRAVREECKELKASSVAVCQTLHRLRAVSEALAEPAWTERRQAAAAPGLEEQLEGAKQHLLSLSRKHLCGGAGGQSSEDASAEVTASDDFALALFNASSARLQQLASAHKDYTAQALEASRATSNAKLLKLLHLEAGFPWELDQFGEDKGVHILSKSGEGEVEKTTVVERTDDEDGEGFEAGEDTGDVVESLLESQRNPVHLADTEQLREEIRILQKYITCSEERAVQFATSLDVERKQSASDLSVEAATEEEQPIAVPKQGTAKRGKVLNRQSFAKLLLKVPSHKKVSESTKASVADSEWDVAQHAAMAAEQKGRKVTENRARATDLNQVLLEIQEEQRLLRNELQLAKSTMPRLMQGTTSHAAGLQLNVRPGELAALRDEVAALGNDVQKYRMQPGMSLLPQRHLAAAEAAREAMTVRHNLWLDEVARLSSLYHEALDRRERAADVLASWDKEHRDAGALDQRACELKSQLHNLDMEAAVEIKSLADLEKARVSAEDACKSAAEQVDKVQQRQFELTHKSKQAVSMSSQLSARLKELQKHQNATKELQAELDAMMATRKTKAQEASSELDGLIEETRRHDEEALRAQGQMEQLTEDLATQKQQLSSELAEYQQTSEAEAKTDADKLDSIKTNCSKIASEIQVKIQTRKARSAAAEKEKVEQQGLVEKRERWLVVNRAKLQKLIENSPTVDLTLEAPPTMEETKTIGATEAVQTHARHEARDAVSASPETSTTPAAEAKLGTRDAEETMAGVADHLVMEAESRSDAVDTVQVDVMAIGNKRPQETHEDDASATEIAVKAARLDPPADSQQSETRTGEAAGSVGGKDLQHICAPFQASPDEADPAEPQQEVNTSLGHAEENLPPGGGRAALDDGNEADTGQPDIVEAITEHVEQLQGDSAAPIEDAACEVHQEVSSPGALVTSRSPTADGEVIEALAQAVGDQLEEAVAQIVENRENDGEQNGQSCREVVAENQRPIGIGTAPEAYVVGNHLPEATQHVSEQSEDVVANLTGGELHSGMAVSEVASEACNTQMTQDDEPESAQIPQSDSAQQYAAAPKDSPEHRGGEGLHDSANKAVESLSQQQCISNKWLTWQRNRRKQLVPVLSNAGTGPRQKRRRTSASRGSIATAEIHQMQQNFEEDAALQMETSAPGGPAVDDDDL